VLTTRRSDIGLAASRVSSEVIQTDVMTAPLQIAARAVPDAGCASRATARSSGLTGQARILL